MPRITRAQAARMGLVNGSQTPQDRSNHGIDPKTLLALCAAHGLPEPVLEYEFAQEIGRKFRGDAVFCGWLILEIQGGIYGKGKPCPACGRRRGGAHSSVKDILRDMERQRIAVILGYQIFPCTPQEVEDGSIFPLIAQALGAQGEQS